MPKVIFIDHSSIKMEVEGKVDASLMEAAVQNMVPGIDADCGGACACATCHVYVQKEWLDKLSPKDDMEESMLDFAENVAQNSRLSCQIILSSDLDGIVVTIPQQQ